jgi:hypothetical protein
MSWGWPPSYWVRAVVTLSPSLRGSNVTFLSNQGGNVTLLSF